MADVRNVAFFVNAQAVLYQELEIFGEKSLAQRSINGEDRGYLRDWLDADINRAFHARDALAASGGTVSFDFGDASLQDLWGAEEAWTDIDHLVVVNHSKDPLGGEADQASGEAVSIKVSGTLIDAMLGITGGNRPYIWGDRGSLAVSMPHSISGGNDVITLLNNHGSLLGYYDLIVLGRGA